MTLRRGCYWLMLAAVLPVPAWSAEPTLDNASLFASPLSDAELEQRRGGFLQDGLEISIGLDQIVSVNGEEMIINRLTIPNLNQRVLDDTVAHTMETVLQVMQPDQSGGTRVSTDLAGGGSGWTTVIQNSLNSTVVQSLHQLNIELNNLSSMNRVPANMSEHLNTLLSR